MQTVEFEITHLTGRGWKTTSGKMTVDETIGTSAGRDEYATARGTVKNLVANRMILTPGTKARLTINGSKVIDMRYGGDHKWSNV